MKVLCLISHTVPLGLGRFDAYEEGRFYDVENPEGACWEKVREDPAPGSKALPGRDPEGKKSGKSRNKADPADGADASNPDRVNEEKEATDHEHD